MRGILVAAAGLVVLSGVALADSKGVSKKDWADCASDEIERSIAGCNKIIDRNKETKADLAIAYTNRGNGYLDKGDNESMYFKAAGP
jgi:hypothetical protein